MRLWMFDRASDAGPGVTRASPIGRDAPVSVGRRHLDGHGSDASGDRTRAADAAGDSGASGSPPLMPSFFGRFRRTHSAQSPAPMRTTERQKRLALVGFRVASYDLRASPWPATEGLRVVWSRQLRVDAVQTGTSSSSRTMCSRGRVRGRHGVRPTALGQAERSVRAPIPGRHRFFGGSKCRDANGMRWIRSGDRGGRHHATDRT